jgi:zinc transport system substrate-binding protein
MNNRQCTIVVIGIIIFTACVFLYFKNSAPHGAMKTSDKKIHVTASFYPLYFFASQIGGDKASVVNITPAGAEPHDYEPSTGDLATIEKSDILIMNGGILETWGDKVKDELKNKKTTVVVAGEGLMSQQIDEENGKMLDPHVWLDPVLAKSEVQKIVAAFQQADPINAPYYQSNASRLEAELDRLNQEFQQGLSSCKQKNIVTSHAAFGYVASRYHLEQVALTGLSPDEEPTPQKLAEIATFAKTHQVTYIFFETLISPRLAETIAKEVGAKTLVFDPLEGLSKDDEVAGKNYLSIQRENLQNLRIALECK